ncbi:MAG: hypothetical protein GYA60_02440 [Candidatus Methanofastidiosa archaeon]|nr:hypothetical protein [Candidatus Methanofastidiosa archaeon]
MQNNKPYLSGKISIPSLITDRCIDEPLIDMRKDKLGFSALLDSFSQYINIFKSRQIIGIYGEWGSGKTTFMNLYLKSLKNKYIKIEFDAWRFKDDKNLWKSFFLNILNNLKEEKNSNGEPIIAGKRYEQFFNKLCYSEDKVTFDFSNRKKWSFVGGISLVIFLVILLYSNSPQFDIYNAILTLITSLVVFFLSFIQIRRSRGPIDSFFEFDKELNLFKDELANTLDKDVTIIILVENLDRVEPKYAIELLESIKTLFEFEGFMYFILCDPTILEKQIQEMYKTETLTAETYLQKIITIPFFLPPVDTYNIERYIKSLLKENDFNERLVHYFKVSGVKNPRKIKKILVEMEMTYRFMKSINNDLLKQKQDIKVPFILKLIILKYEYSYIFQLIKMYVETKNNKLENAAKYILNGIPETPRPDDVTRVILDELLNFSPRDTAMNDRDNYPISIKETMVKISRGLNFIDKTRNDKYGISNLSELNAYLLSVAATGKSYDEKVEFGIGLSLDVKGKRKNGT